MHKFSSSKFKLIILFSSYCTLITASNTHQLINNINNDSKLISLFPIENYDQKIANWIKPNDPDYDKPLISKDQQSKRLSDFYNHYFPGSIASTSPWDATYISKILGMTGSNSLLELEKN